MSRPAAFRHLLVQRGLATFGNAGSVTLPVASLQDLPAATSTVKARMGVYVNPLGGTPDVTLPWDRVQLQLLVRIDAGNPDDSNLAGQAHAQKCQDSLHGVGDGYPLLIGTGGDQLWLSSLLARDTAPVSIGSEQGSSTPRWSVVFTADIANMSAARQEQQA